MPRGPCTFKQCDVVRAVKASRAAGLEVVRTEIGPDGRIVLVHKPSGEIAPTLPVTDYEKWKAIENGAR